MIRLPARVAQIMLIVVFSNPVYAMQPPPPPLGMSQLRDLIGEADIVVVGEVKEVRETGEAVDGGNRVRIDAVLKTEKILKGKYGKADLLIEESYTTAGSMGYQCTPAAGEERGKVIAGAIAGPAQYHGIYRKGSRIVALLAPIKGSTVYSPLGSGTYDKHLCEFFIENGAVRALNFSFAADLERSARSESEFINLIATLSERRE